MTLPTQEVIERKLKSNKDDVEFYINNNVIGTLDVWTKFGIVCHRNGTTSILLELAACKVCKKTFMHKKTTGTKMMGLHKCVVQQSDVRVAKQFFKKHVPMMKVKAKMTEAVASFCAKDMCPFEALSGLGLNELIQIALDIVIASSGRILIEDLLAHPVTIRRHVTSRAQSGHERLVIILKDHFESGVGAACTIDLWTDTIKKVSYMSMTIHYIDKLFTLNVLTMHVKPLREASHTMIMVLNEFKEGLSLFELLTNYFDHITIVTDCGSSICWQDSISSEFSWLPCLDHKLASMLTTDVNKTTTMMHGVQHIVSPHAM